ncbi:MAG: glutathione S-transferase family protein [Reyranella sp.]|uniref:glutathione S-transferase family protein n=1 Tax=Reyranella sp. TaxID=1929291 RepID=UPI003D12A59E
MKIYGVPLSVHTRKVLVAARLKGVPFDLDVVIPVVPDNPPANWRDISPTGLIPAIDDGGFRLADSTAIIHYMERKHPTPALLPADSKELGAAVFLDAWAGSALFRNVVHPIFHNQVVNPNIRKLPADQAAIDAAVNEAAPEAFGYLESRAPEAFLVGGELSIADLAVVSNLIVFHYLGRRIDDRFPKLQTYFRRHLDSPVLGAALADERPYVAQMGLDLSFIG